MCGWDLWGLPMLDAAAAGVVGKSSCLRLNNRQDKE